MNTQRSLSWKNIFDFIHNLTTILGYENRISEFANGVVPVFADWCAIDVFDSSESMRRMAVAHHDPKKRKIAINLYEKYPPTKEDIKNLYNAVKNQNLVFYPEITDKIVKDNAKDDDHYKILKSLDISSVAIVPLSARGLITGVATFVRESGKRYEEEDREFLQALGNQGAILFENARLYSESVNSKNALEIALDAGQMAIWEWNIQTGKIRWSESFYKIHGVTPGTFDAKYKSIQKMIHPKDRNILSNNIKDAIKKDETFFAEFRIIKPDKKIAWISVHGKITEYDNKNKPLKMTGVGMDITAKKQSENQLKRHSEKFYAIFDNSLDPILIVNNKSVIVDCNLAARKIFRKKIKTLKGKNLKELVIGNIENKKGEIQIKKRQGFFVYSKRSSITPRTKLYFIHDISEQKYEIRRSEHFISIAGHELKNPIAAIKALCHLMLSSKKVMKDHLLMEQIEKINKRSDMLNGLIRDLLDVNRIKQNRLDLNLSIVNFNDLVKTSVNEFNEIQNTHNVKIEGKADVDIILDEDRISEVIVNLLKNAAKYSPKSKEILLNLEENKKRVLCTIEDFGIGIPEEEISKIFEIYYRNAKSAQSFEGMGVGLYISNEIVKAHGGRMWVKSKIGEGSKFTFMLYLKPKIYEKKKAFTN